MSDKTYPMAPPPNLTEEQLRFWNDRFLDRLHPIGHVRRRLALMRKEWRTEHGYRKLSFDWTDDLDNHPGFAEQLLADETKLIAYAAALRLRGA